MKSWRHSRTATVFHTQDTHAYRKKTNNMNKSQKYKKIKNEESRTKDWRQQQHKDERPEKKEHKNREIYKKYCIQTQHQMPLNNWWCLYCKNGSFFSISLSLPLSHQRLLFQLLVYVMHDIVVRFSWLTKHLAQKPNTNLL